MEGLACTLQQPAHLLFYSLPSALDRHTAGENSSHPSTGSLVPSGSVTSKFLRPKPLSAVDDRDPRLQWQFKRGKSHIPYGERQIAFRAVVSLLCAWSGPPFVQTELPHGNISGKPTATRIAAADTTAAEN